MLKSISIALAFFLGVAGSASLGAELVAKSNAQEHAIQDLSAWYAATPDSETKSKIESCFGRLLEKRILFEPSENEYDVDLEQLARADLEEWYNETHSSRISRCFAELDRDALSVSGESEIPAKGAR